MKNSAAVSRFEIWSVLPPMLAERIRRHYHAVYGRRFTPAEAFARFWHEFINDEAFRERIQTNARKLQPIDPEECAGIGFFLGLSFEESLSDYLAGLPASRLVRLEREVVHSGAPLEEVFIKSLVKSKAIAEYPADPLDWRDR
jgi:hypothetical protein